MRVLLSRKVAHRLPCLTPSGLILAVANDAGRLYMPHAMAQAPWRLQANRPTPPMWRSMVAGGLSVQQALDTFVQGLWLPAVIQFAQRDNFVPRGMAWLCSPAANVFLGRETNLVHGTKWLAAKPWAAHTGLALAIAPAYRCAVDACIDGGHGMAQLAVIACTLAALIVTEPYRIGAACLYAAVTLAACAVGAAAMAVNILARKYALVTAFAAGGAMPNFP